MRLTDILFRKNYFPNGNIFKGKYRLVRRVVPTDLRRLEQDFALEEKNMLFLRHPYLTEAESSGHAKALGKPEQRKQKILDASRRHFKEDVTIYERLQHLRVGEKWE